LKGKRVFGLWSFGIISLVIMTGRVDSQPHRRVTKSVCLSAFRTEDHVLKQQLLTLAKRHALAELFGEHITSLSEVRNLTLTRDEIESRSSGFVRIDGDPDYYSKGFGEGCVRIQAYATAEDFARFEPQRISKKACESEGDVRTIQQRAETKARLEAVRDYHAVLRGHPPERLLRLLHRVTYDEQGFIPATSYYCVKATGIVYPLEVEAILGRTVPPSVPFENTSIPKTWRNSINMEFVLIPAGEFMMGSPDTVQQAWDSEKPVHRVTISKPFYMGKYEVTQSQWQAVMGDNPSQFEGANRPVESVSWEDVQTFIRTLNQKAGYEACRLPTEAQWEYAARAGSTTIYHFSDDPAHLGDHAWYEENAGGYTHSVGQKKPNAWGLYDMHGNVHEWVQDWYHKTYYQNSPTVDPQGLDTGVGRVVRGGGWRRPAQYVRAADRSWYTPGSRVDHIGFRCSSSGVN
jgi:formylglycine-generating enzyme required for sulfatase activity